MLIGLKGYKGVGKDEVAKYLVENHGFEHLTFATKLKEAVAGLFDISVDQVNAFKDNQGGNLDRVEVHIDIGGVITYSYGWREILQRFGTEMGREVFGEDFWLDQVLPDVSPHYIILNDVVISDVRFENEARRVKQDGGYVVEIVRPGYEPDGHASEESLPPELIDIGIFNDGSLDDLAWKTQLVLDELRERQGLYSEGSTVNVPEE